jgi:hypothetical protein
MSKKKDSDIVQAFAFTKSHEVVRLTYSQSKQKVMEVFNLFEMTDVTDNKFYDNFIENEVTHIIPVSKIDPEIMKLIPFTIDWGFASPILVEDLLGKIPNKTYNCQPFGLQIMVTTIGTPGMDAWSVGYYTHFDKTFDDRFPVVIGRSIQEALFYLYVWMCGYLPEALKGL